MVRKRSYCSKSSVKLNEMQWNQLDQKLLVLAPGLGISSAVYTVSKEKRGVLLIRVQKKSKKQESTQLIQTSHGFSKG